MSDDKRSPCEGCALTEGAAANCEAENNLKAMLCVLGAIPFYCHEGMDWKNEELHHITRKEARAQGGMTPCAGWKREVAELARTGFYKDRGPLKKEFARIGMINLQTFVDAPSDSEEKRRALEVLDQVVDILHQERRKFSTAVTVDTNG